MRPDTPFSAYTFLLVLANRFPLSIVQLAGRVAIFDVVWNTQLKLASWPVTLQLFAFGYRVPLPPPDVVAVLATFAELGGAGTRSHWPFHSALRFSGPLG